MERGERHVERQATGIHHSDAVHDRVHQLRRGAGLRAAGGGAAEVVRCGGQDTAWGQVGGRLLLCGDASYVSGGILSFVSVTVSRTECRPQCRLGEPCGKTKTEQLSFQLRLTSLPMGWKTPGEGDLSHEALGAVTASMATTGYAMLEMDVTLGNGQGPVPCPGVPLPPPLSGLCHGAAVPHPLCQWSTPPPSVHKASPCLAQVGLGMGQWVR